MPTQPVMLWQRFLTWVYRHQLPQKIPLLLGFIAIVFGFITYQVISSDFPAERRWARLMPWVIADFLVLLGLLVCIGKRVVEVWQERKHQRRGAKLHAHIAGLFGLFAIIPAVIMIPFMGSMLNMGLEWWFAGPIQRALEEAHEVTQAYVHESQRTIFIDAHVMSKSIQPHIVLWLDHKKSLEEALTQVSEERGITEAIVLNDNGHVLGRSFLGFSLEFEPVLIEDFARAKAGEVVVRHSPDRVRALVQLDALTNTFLFLSKATSKTMQEHLAHADKAIADYHIQREQHEYAHIVWIGFFFLVAVLLVLAAIWVGLIIADTLVDPIRKLITAADDLSQGQWGVHVEDPKMNNDLDDLVRAFNHMIERLLQQQQELVMTQKQAAWADIARKIAHEIKNPLTPIQLSAERLKRRYMKHIHDDPQTFDDCVQTIIRQVAHIEHLVSEFASFARMPESNMVEADIVPICKEVLFLQSAVYSHIQFTYKGEKQLRWMCDPQYMHQALINLVQNAAQALSEQAISNGQVVLEVEKQGTKWIIRCMDNGPGFPSENRDRIMEPYYTTRAKGTGLGLAITAKIISDHKGKLMLKDAPGGGACLELTFG